MDFGVSHRFSFPEEHPGHLPHPKYLTSIDGVNPEEATSLACSGLTAYTAVKKANVSAPRYLVIIGAGGLGLMGVQVAKAVTDAKIICVDLDDKKLDVAKSKGADYIFNSKESGTVEKIIETCGGLGAESVIDFVNAPPTAKMGLAVLRKRGNLVLVGLFGGSMHISHYIIKHTQNHPTFVQKYRKPWRI